MKLLNAGTTSILNFAAYSRNCNLGGCRRIYYVPVPTLSDVELFINFGTVKPASVDFTAINICSPYDSMTINSDCFIIAHNGSYWYGIYKSFTGSDFSIYIIACSVGYEGGGRATFFSEQYENAQECDTLTKVSVCYPSNYNSEDINGIYVGQRNTSQTYSGKVAMFYQHNFWVRNAEIIETGNKITFTSNPYKSFASKLNKTFEFRPGELVPGWYKDYLLSVYFRGNILINNIAVQVTDLAFEMIVEEADLWKAYCVLGKEIKGAFGCADIICPADDCICYAVTIPEIFFDDAMVGIPYIKTIPLAGTAPFQFVITEAVDLMFPYDFPYDFDAPIPGSLPPWMTGTIVGTNLVLSGTPTLGDVGSHPINFTITNDCSSVDFNNDSTITVEIVVAETEAHFTATTFVSGNAFNEIEIANIIGVPGSTVTVTLDDVINNNGGQLKVNESPVFISNTFNVVLDSSGNGQLPVEIYGVANPNTAIRGHFTITSVSDGTIGAPNSYQISKVF